MSTLHRIYRQDGVTYTPGTPADPGGTRYDLVRACGNYPAADVHAALDDLIHSKGYDPTDFGALERGLANYLTLDRLQSDSSAAATYSAYGFGETICAYFKTPVVVPPSTGTDSATKLAASGWTSGAVSTGCFADSGWIKFRVQSGKKFVVGLQDGLDPTNPRSRFVGLYFDGDLISDVVRWKADHAGNMQYIYEGDFGWPTVSEPWNNTEAEYMITYRNGYVEFRVDGTPLVHYYADGGYIPPHSLWRLGAAIFEPGTWVDGLEIGQYVDMTVTLPALRGRAGAGTPKSQALTTLPLLTVSSRSATRSAGTLPKLVGVGGNPYAFSYTTLPVLTGAGAEYPPVPSTISRSAGIAPRLTARAHVLVGEVGRVNAAPLPLLKCFATQGKKCIAVTSLPALNGFAAAFPFNEVHSYSGAGVSAPLAVAEELVLVFNSSFTVAAAAVVYHEFTKDASSTVSVTGAFIPSEQLFATLHELLTLASADAADDSTTWVMNLVNAGTSTYENYDFNSFGTLSGYNFGAKADGIYLLNGADDNGSPIRPSVSFGKQNFGSKNLKTMLRAYVGASSSGTLYLKITADGTDYIYAARTNSSNLKQQRFDVGRGLRATYFTFELFNNDGSSLELDDITFVAADVQRKV